ncbi:MAG: hypothetical protein A2V88_11740 [Elusimicrobia bacterium RBG_16_66_12]|nr:MAG: hypothetical protein A2V88_11740 [Elusimicrobia bacterium RBG_16_66_12]
MARILLLLVVPLSVHADWAAAGARCGDLMKEGAAALEAARQCSDAQECAITAELACPFDCQSAVNKNADLSRLKEIAGQCRSDIVCESCVFPEARAECKDSRCVLARESEEILVVVDRKTARLNDTVSVTIKNRSREAIDLAPWCGAPLLLLQRVGPGWKSHSPYPTKDCAAPSKKLEPMREITYSLALQRIYFNGTGTRMKPGVCKFEAVFSRQVPMRPGVPFQKSQSDELPIVR